MFGRHPTYDLIPYLRGELKGHKLRHVEDHLGTCRACADETAALAQTLKLIARQLEGLPTPDWTEYRRELRLRLAGRQEQRSWWRLGVIWGPLAAAGVAALVLLSLNMMHAEETVTPAVEQLALADANVDLLRNYPVVERMDMLENYDVIEHLDELQKAPAQSAQARPL